MLSRRLFTRATPALILTDGILMPIKAQPIILTSQWITLVDTKLGYVHPSIRISRNINYMLYTKNKVFDEMLKSLIL